MSYDAVISNPPYSLKWSADSKLQIQDFSLAPKSKADYQFILEGISRLDDDGIAVYVLPHGVLFRGQAEGKVRQELIEKNYLDTVIGLPENLFDVTSIPVCLMIFKKKRDNKDILFIDASKEFTKGKNQNKLEPEHVQNIIKAYQDRTEIDKYSHVATQQELEENEFNLNIPRYVDTFEPEPVPDIDQLMTEINEIDAELLHTQQELDVMLQDLVGTNPQSQAEIERFKKFWHKRVKEKESEQMTLL